MIRMAPTPARASKEARAEPVAPHPTRATRAAASFCCPSRPIPGKSTCREYLSSRSKEITSSRGTNLYYRCRSVSQAKATLPDASSSNIYYPHARGGGLRLEGAIGTTLTGLALVAVLCLNVAAQSQPAQAVPGAAPVPQSPEPAPSPPTLGGMAGYEGLIVEKIDFPDLPSA